MRLSMADGSGPDWGVIGGAVAAVVTAVAAVVANARGAFRDWRTDQEKASTDHTVLTLDGVFRLVNELQEEAARREAQTIANEARCTARETDLQRRIATLERANARQAEMIADLRTEIRALKER